MARAREPCARVGTSAPTRACARLHVCGTTQFRDCLRRASLSEAQIAALEANPQLAACTYGLQKVRGQTGGPVCCCRPATSREPLLLVCVCVSLCVYHVCMSAAPSPSALGAGGGDRHRGGSTQDGAGPGPPEGRQVRVCACRGKRSWVCVYICGVLSRHITEMTRRDMTATLVLHLMGAYLWCLRVCVCVCT